MFDYVRSSAANNIAVGAFAAGLAVSASAFAQEGDATASTPLPSVGVIEVTETDVRTSAEFVGRAEAVQRVDLLPRITGFLEKQAFSDGQRVKAGDLLFVIEQEPFAADVQQAQANLEAAEAEAENANVSLARAEELIQNQNIAQATVDERRAASLIAKAAIAQSQAELRQREITYSYTEIRTPIDGRVGRSSVKVGNLVTPETGVLATVVKEDPIYVLFSVTEKRLLEFRKEVGAFGRPIGEGDRVELELRLSDGSIYDYTGSVDFADVEVNPTTDTITLRGEFANPEGILVDRQFVTVVARERMPRTAVTIPTTTIAIDQQGEFVLVVDTDNKVAKRPIKVESESGGVAVIRSGLEVGELLIVDGLMKVRPGMEVRTTPAAGA